MEAPLAVGVTVGVALAPVMAQASATASAPTSAATPRVLLVGTYKGISGQYTTIQSAVDAAKPGDWVLVAPGDYHETADLDKPPTPEMASAGGFGGVLITKAGLHVRGMDRNATIVDGDKPGSSTPCNPAPEYQSYGSLDAKGNPIGRNGIVAYQANNVYVENLTVCNFLGGSGSAGFEIWWDGGEGSGKIGMTGYWGSYLNATSTFYKVPVKGAIDVNATYGIFANSAAGPAKWDDVYASNMNDSGAYVGACQQQCDVTIDHSWFEYNALGYSGTNSGGAVVIRNSEFDHNQDGLDTNTQIAGNPPPPQDGRCPGGETAPSRTRLVLGLPEQQRARQQQRQRPRRGHRRPGPRRHRHDDLRRPLEHRHEQHLHEQRRVGCRVPALPRQRHSGAADHV